MKYIKQITLDNFQSHKHTVVDLDKGLNVIVGPSDTGKTAIIRAIKWILYNEPAGDYFIREGENDCRVTIEFSDKVIIERYRSKSKNKYILKNKYGDVLEFEGFGSKVPYEISEATGIKKISLDINESTSINLGEQLEGAFLLSEKNSLKASAIGRLVGVNIIDDALRDLLKDTRTLNITKKNIEDNIIVLKSELIAFYYLDNLKEKLLLLLKIKNNIENKQEKLSKLQILFKSMNDIKIDKNENALMVDRLNVVNHIKYIVTNIDTIYIRYKYINLYYLNLYKTKLDIKDTNKTLSKLKNIEILNKKFSLLNLKTVNLNNLSLLYEKLLINKQEMVIVINILNELSQINDIDRNLRLLSKKTAQINNLIKTKDKLYMVNKNINLGNKYILMLNHTVSIDRILPLLNEDITKLNKINTLKTYYMNYSKEISIQNDLIKKTDKSINILLDNYRDLLMNFETCPFCFNNIKEDNIDHIINHYMEVI